MDLLTYTQIAANVATVAGVVWGGLRLLSAALTSPDGRSASGKKNGSGILDILGGFSKKQTFR